MRRTLAIITFVVAALTGIAVAGFTTAQEAATTADSGGACATPVGSPVATPATSGMVAASPEATPCATPAGGASAAQPAVTMVDIAFQPNTLTIPAGQDVQVALTNNGAAVHNFNIDELNVHSGDFQPGQTGTVTINAAAGTYTYYCNIPGHKEAGMVGQLTVQ